MTISHERREAIRQRLEEKSEDHNEIMCLYISDLRALLADSAWRERVERQVRELEDRLVEAVAHEAQHNREGNAHMLRYWKDQIGAIVDTGDEEEA